MFAEYKGVKIDYRTVGQGPDLVMLHGWGCTGEYFRPVVRALQDSFRITLIDFPGHGKSDTPQEVWNADDFMEGVVQVFRAAGIEKAHIIAHSHGARVTIKLASRYPELTDKLILTGAAGILPKRGAKYYWKVYSYKLLKRLYKVKFLVKLALFFGFDIEQRVNHAGSDDYKVLSDAMKGTFIRLVNEDVRGLLPRIQSSTLLVFGDRDTATPLWMGQIMEREIPDAGLVVYHGTHYAFLENVQAFNQVCRVFLKEEK